MRLLLILLCCLLFSGTAWFAVSVGSTATHFVGAPQIETSIDRATMAAVVPIARHPLDVRTDGRWVTLVGTANSDAERDDLVARANAVAGTLLVVDELTVLPVSAPFVFEARRGGDGLSLAGHAPTEAAREAIIQHARPLFASAGVRESLSLASGAPAGDWTGMVIAGLDALAGMKDGLLTVENTSAHIVGLVDGEAGEAAVETIVAAAPFGDWETDLTLALPRADPYRFEALKAADRTVTVAGHAPDKATRAALLEAAGATGTLALADGMPSPDWAETTEAGLAALGVLSEGRIAREGTGGLIAGAVETDEDLARLIALTPPGWTREVTVRAPAPRADLRIDLAADGTLSATGLLPQGMEASDLATRLPTLAATDLSGTAGPGEADWTRALDALAIVLVRMEAAEARLTGDRMTLGGTLRPGFSASGAEAALRTASGRSWQIEATLTERDQPARIVLSGDTTALAVSGVLPRGISPGDALDLLGNGAGGQGLTGGGGGDAGTWRAALGALAVWLPRFATVSGRIDDGAIALTGQLEPGYRRDALAVRIASDLPDGWTLDLDAAETAPSEGDLRTGLDSGETERFQRGFWLPVFDFHPAPETCHQRAEAALAHDGITFVAGSAEIDGSAHPLLDWLAGIALRCLNSSAIRLALGGHTDQVGNDADNLALSHARAEAVRAALIARGVKASAISATGYGETQPIASNDTPEGRAANRRISFDWGG